jgi:hypothetical protein
MCSPCRTSPSTSDRRATASNEVFAGGYRTGADFRTITWTMDRAAQGINYTHRELDENFLNVVS